MSVPRPLAIIVIAQLEIGGAERQVVNLATGLAEQGIEAEVAVFYKDGDLEGALLEAGIPVYTLRRSTMHGFETVLDLRRYLRARNPQIVHSFLWPANWRMRAAALGSGIPVIVSSPRSVETWLRWYHVAVDRYLAGRTDAIVVNATAIRDFLIRRERLAPELFHVIHNGIDLRPFENLPSREEARARLGLAPSVPMVLIVGNLEPEKNHEDFLRMAASLLHQHREASWVVVGGGPQREYLAAFEKELGIAGKIWWTGRRSDAPLFNAASDVVLNTSHREGCCNAILEAMAASRPVVAYSVGGNPELVIHGATGRLVPFGQVDALSAAVASYLENRAEAEAHGAEGARRVHAEFSRESMILRTASLYREILERKGWGRAEGPSANGAAKPGKTRA